jgi:hypothetical protein
MKKLSEILGRTCIWSLLLLISYPGVCQVDLSTDLERFDQGDTKVFITNGLFKSQGLNMKITLPSNWEKAEAQMPNVIKQFFSPRGGALMITVMKDKTKSTFSPSEVVANTGRKQLEKLFPAPVRIFSINSTVKLNGRAAAAVTYKMLINGDNNFDGADRMVKSITYITYYKNYAVILGFSVTGKSEDFVDELFENISPVFSRIANSIRITP